MDTMNSRQRTAKFNAFYSTWTQRLLGVLRSAVALLSIEHGSKERFRFSLHPTAQQLASGEDS
jgi:hypothetical protein